MTGRKVKNSRPCRKNGDCLGLILAMAVGILMVIHTSAYGGEQQPSGSAAGQQKEGAIPILDVRSKAPVEFGMAIRTKQAFNAGEASPFFAVTDPFKASADPQASQKADVSSIIRIALDEFGFLAGLKDTVKMAERRVGSYTQKLMLTGEFNFEPQSEGSPDTPKWHHKINLGARIYKNQRAKSAPARNSSHPFIDQLQIDRLAWDIDVDPADPEFSFDIQIGRAFTMNASAGDSASVGAFVKLSL